MSDTPTTPAEQPKPKTIRAEVNELYDPNDLLGIDQDTLDPAYYYRIGYEGQQRQAILRAKGFVPVSRSEDGVKLTTDTQAGAAEDIIRIGDGILMRCPRHLYEGRRAEVSRLTHARLNAPEGQFRKKADKVTEVITNRDMKPRR